MSSYSINPVAAQNVADELTRATNQLQASLADLQTAVAQFTAANAGNAPEAYAEAQRLWDAGQKEMTVSLANGRVALEEITTNYVNSDKHGAAMFS